MSDALEQFLAKSCHYAQEHIGDAEAWSMDTLNRHRLLQCTSYQVACFISQNTVAGGSGVDWDVVITELVANDPPVKTEAQWREIIAKIASEYGGWIDDGIDANRKDDRRLL